MGYVSLQEGNFVGVVHKPVQKIRHEAISIMERQTRVLLTLLMCEQPVDPAENQSVDSIASVLSLLIILCIYCLLNNIP